MFFYIQHIKTEHLRNKQPAKHPMLLEDQLPRIRKLIREKIGIIPKNAIYNDDLMRNSFKRLYQALPRMIRMTISENLFVEFCMANRERLLHISDKDSEKYSEGETNYLITLPKSIISGIVPLLTSFIIIYNKQNYFLLSLPRSQS